jgi:hypothetical protein
MLRPGRGGSDARRFRDHGARATVVVNENAVGFSEGAATPELWAAAFRLLESPPVFDFMRTITMADNPLAGLKASLRGELITRDDGHAFTAARFRGWNRDLNARVNPLGFVVVSGVRDIVTTVNYCRSNNIPIAVRGKGAHSPYGMANDAVVIDLMKMTAVRVDPERKLAFVQAVPMGAM